MTLKQPFKLNDIQNRPLVVFCALMIAILIYVVREWKQEKTVLILEVRRMTRERDSIDRARIEMYEELIFERMRNATIRENTDSLLRAKTQKSTETILNNNK